ncbi:MAG: peptidylprolyl isomerase [Dehalococcoidales bacterium]|nr:peptidylprolyl isomerase [Dehalococcoidales bacterium]
MAKKSKNLKPHREMTKRQLSHWQQQKKRQRIIFIAGIVTIAVVVVLVLAGWFFGSFLPMQQPVISVNGRVFDAGYYINMLRITSQANPQYTSLYTDIVARNIQQNELIRQAALQLNISVTNDEIKKKIGESKLANTEVYRDLAQASLLLEKIREEYIDPEIPQTADQRQIMAVLLETAKQATEARTKLEASANLTGDFAKLAEEQAVDTYSKSKKGDYGWHSREVLADILTSQIPLDFAFSAAAGEFSQPLRDDDASKNVGYWVIKVVNKSAEGDEADLMGMLLGTDEEARNVIQRLNAGEDFAAIAKERSQIGTAKEDGGALGLIAKDQMSDAVDEFVFDAATKDGALSGPIRDDTVTTKGGYWLIKVVAEQKDRIISTEDRDYLKSKALQEWIDLLAANPLNVIDDSALTAEMKAWAVEQATKGR